MCQVGEHIINWSRSKVSFSEGIGVLYSFLFKLPDMGMRSESRMNCKRPYQRQMSKCQSAGQL